MFYNLVNSLCDISFYHHSCLMGKIQSSLIPQIFLNTYYVSGTILFLIESQHDLCPYDTSSVVDEIATKQI